MTDWGIKITVPGKAVSSTDPRDSSLWSGFQGIMRLQTQTSGTATPKPAYYDPLLIRGELTVTVTHDLGYVPFVQVFLNWHQGASSTGIRPATYSTSYGSVLFSPKITATQVLLRWLGTLDDFTEGDITCDYDVFVGRDPLN